MKLRRFTEDGHQRFREIYENIKISVIDEGWAKGYKEDHKGHLKELLDKTFDTSYELGDYLCSLLSGADKSEINHDKYLWDWLSLYYFDQIIPLSGKSGYDNARIFYNDEWTVRYRHLIRTPWYVISNFGKYAKILKNDKPFVGGDYNESFMGQPVITRIPASCEITYKLYFDEKLQKQRAGLSKQKNDKPGNIYRLFEQMKQFQCVYNMYELDADSFIKLLPNEFDYLKPEHLKK